MGEGKFCVVTRSIPGTLCTSLPVCLPNLVGTDGGEKYRRFHTSVHNPKVKKKGAPLSLIKAPSLVFTVQVHINI